MDLADHRREAKEELEVMCTGLSLECTTAATYRQARLLAPYCALDVWIHHPGTGWWVLLGCCPLLGYYMGLAVAMVVALIGDLSQNHRGGVRHCPKGMAYRMRV